MKRFYLLLSLWFGIGSPVLLAQEYTFQVLERPFEPLDNPVLLSGVEVWGGEEWQVPIGFTFNFLGLEVATCTLWEGTAYFSEDEHYFDAFGASFIDLAWYLDLPTSYSKVSYQLEGIPGEQILKMEYLETGFWDGDEEDVLSFQIWLYEGSNFMEVCLGPSMVSSDVYAFDGWEGPYIGISDELAGTYLYLEGDPTAPIPYTTDENTTGLVGTPVEGMVYRFLPDSLLSGKALHPPERLTVCTQENGWILKGEDLSNYDSWNLYDQDGKRLRSGPVSGSVLEIPKIRTENGLLLIQLVGQERIYTERMFGY